MTNPIARPETQPNEGDAFYLLACAILWRKTANMSAGWELIQALASPDPGSRWLAASLLSQEPRPTIPVLCTVYLG